MVGIEDQKNAVRSLKYVKNNLKINPKLVTCDFSPSLISAVNEVYGEEKLQIDGFHVMQLLNNGIRKDISLFRDKMFRKEIGELLNLRKWLNTIQNGLKEGHSEMNSLISNHPRINTNHKSSTMALKLSSWLLQSFHIVSPSTFEKSIRKAINILITFSKREPLVVEFCTYLEDKFPKRQLTEKGHMRIKQAIIKGLKKLCIHLQQPLDKEKKEFASKSWALFFQPEKLTTKRKQILNELLTQYPELEEYRAMTLQVGSIYRKSVDDITRREIGDLMNQPHFSDKLNTAINTLKSNQESIYRFVNAFKEDPTLGKESRSNTEFLNRDFKAPFKHGLGCLGKEHLQAKIGLQMGCKVRWLLKAQ
mgnify:CR=1 FL=1